MEKKDVFALADCNSFYTACEKVFRPELANKPVAVLSNNDGCVVALSEEAKSLGVTRGDPFFKVEHAIRAAGGAVFSSNYALYGDMSGRVMTVLSRFAPRCDIYSIDECFLDLTGFAGDLKDYGNKIRDSVKRETGIPVSVGIAPTKTLAKAANLAAKKDGGVFELHCADIGDFLCDMPVNLVWGIGPRYTRKLAAAGIKNAREFAEMDQRWVRQNLGGITGLRTQNELRCISCIDTENALSKKEIVCSRSFSTPVKGLGPMEEALSTYAQRAAAKLRRQGSLARMVLVYMHTGKFAGGSRRYGNTASLVMESHTDSTASFIQSVKKLGRSIYRGGYEYKKAGVMLGDIIKAGDEQRKLVFSDNDNNLGTSPLMAVMDGINRKWGRDSILYAASGIKKPWSMKREMLSPRYTTCWDEILNVSI